jgi:hypothetical protein
LLRACWRIATNAASDAARIRAISEFIETDLAARVTAALVGTDSTLDLPATKIHVQTVSRAPLTSI